VRFEIDRRFKEKHIEIAFPQRDIHIKSNMDNANKIDNNLSKPEE